MNVSISSSSVSAKTRLSSASSVVTPGTRLGVDSQKVVDRDLFLWCCLALLVALGSLGLSPQFIFLWDIWTTDPLRSIGMLIVPTSVLLVLRVWRQRKWELRGTWWGLLLVALAFFPILSSQNLILSLGTGPLNVHLLPYAFPLYLYASGIILLFAGTRVWAQAWFPLALLWCAQPVPSAVVYLLDLPLQSLAAHIARSFATLIGFSPTSPELLKLMFTPDFGMFIAPGCDGMRGAVTLGYGALVIGYLKRVSILRWFLYVSGAVFLGHLFNLIRLCALVLYYRIALGHPVLESIAKQADYAIGGFLFLVAVVLFLYAGFRKEDKPILKTDFSTAHAAVGAGKHRITYWKAAAFAILVFIVVVPGTRAIQINRESLVASIRNGEVTPGELDDRMPKQLGNYSLVRAWQEQFVENTILESAAYRSAAPGEVILNIWLMPSPHSVHGSWATRGETPEIRATKSFLTARGQPVPFDMGLYNDGVTDRLAGNIFCTPSSCVSSFGYESSMHFSSTNTMDFATRGIRMVPISFWVEQPHVEAPKEVIYQELSAQCQNFLSGVDFTELSRRFQ